MEKRTHVSVCLVRPSASGSQLYTSTMFNYVYVSDGYIDHFPVPKQQHFHRASVDEHFRA